jgi:hypothetical protein
VISVRVGTRILPFSVYVRRPIQLVREEVLPRTVAYRLVSGTAQLADSRPTSDRFRQPLQPDLRRRTSLSAVLGFGLRRCSARGVRVSRVTASAKRYSRAMDVSVPYLPAQSGREPVVTPISVRYLRGFLSDV